VLSIPATGTRTWDPDCHRGEGASARQSLRRKDLWFFVGLLLFVVLLFFVWQQNRGLQLAAEVTRLEVRRETLRTKILEQGVVVAQRRQPLQLMSDSAGELALSDLQGRIFVPAARAARAQGRGQDTWLASVGLGVAPALAADGR